MVFRTAYSVAALKMSDVRLETHPRDNLVANEELSETMIKFDPQFYVFEYTSLCLTHVEVEFY